MANTTPNIGQQCKLYRGSDFTDAMSSDNWLEVENVEDLNLGSEHDKAAANTRATRRKRYLLGLQDNPITFNCLWDPSDADFAAFLDAHLNGTILPVMVLDGDKDEAGTEGLKADFYVSKCEEQQVLGEATKADIELCIAYSANLPDWVTATT